MSALGGKADMVQHERDVRFVPKADIRIGRRANLRIRSMLAAATTFLQLRQYLVQREAAGLLPRREVDVGL